MLVPNFYWSNLNPKPNGIDDNILQLISRRSVENGELTPVVETCFKRSFLYLFNNCFSILNYINFSRRKKFRPKTFFICLLCKCLQEKKIKNNKDRSCFGCTRIIKLFSSWMFYIEHEFPLPLIDSKLRLLI